MNKILLLTKSHFRKNKGTSVGLVSLMLIAAMLLSLSLVVLFDAYPMARKEAERLDSGDGFFRISEGIDGLTDEKIEEIIEDDVSRYYIYRCLNYITQVPFADGTITANAQIYDDRAFSKEMGNSEIVTEDTSITSDYIYLPYQFYTSGGVDVGDQFVLEIQGKKYDLTVRGFLTTPYFGCNNSGSYEFVLDDDTYSGMVSVDGAPECILVIYELKDGVEESRFGIRVNNDIVTVAPYVNFQQMPVESVISNRTFISLIIVISFLVLSGVVLLVVLFMLTSSISNYIRENIKMLGALKAIGYTSSDIRVSVTLLFLMLSCIGAIGGIVLSYALLPFFAQMSIAQMGIPYSISFLPVPTLIVFSSIVLFTAIVVSVVLIRISKIEPIVALRSGIESHSFRKNHVRLDKTSMGLDMSLAMKTMFFNIKQNIITFIVVGIMVFLCTLGLLMYENFSVHPKVDMLTFEYCGGIAAFDHETAEDAREFLEEQEGVSNVRNMIMVYFYYGDEDKLMTYVIDDLSALNNVNVCFEGRLPLYDNEIAVSGKFASAHGIKVGDTIPMSYGDETFDYLITGFIQTTNNGGKEAYMSARAASRITDLSNAPAYYYFDTETETEEEVDRILTKCEDKYGEHMISKMNFYGIIAGSLTTFKSVATTMLVSMCVISVLVILLVMFLLVKALILNKRKDYGIFKAIGFTSGNLVLQTALSFTPSIVISVILSSILSYCYANKFMNLIMGAFGIVKSRFDIPIPGVVMIAIGMILISFLLAIFESRKVKRIEAYTLLVAE